MKYYKVLNEDGSACCGGHGKWHLPKNGRPGKWMPKIKGKLIACENGYHLCRRGDLIAWLGPAIWLAEGRGKKVVAPDKVVFEQARLIKRLNWDGRVARLFACDCAERALRVYEKQHPNDNRPRKTIEFAWPPRRSSLRFYAIGWAAERKWQTKRLFEYLKGKRGCQMTWYCKSCGKPTYRAEKLWLGRCRDCHEALQRRYRDNMVSECCYAPPQGEVDDRDPEEITGRCSDCGDGSLFREPCGCGAIRAVDCICDRAMEEIEKQEAMGY